MTTSSLPARARTPVLLWLLLTACGSPAPYAVPDGGLDGGWEHPDAHVPDAHVPDADVPADADVVDEGLTDQGLELDVGTQEPSLPTWDAQLGGVPGALALAGGRAYVGVGPRLEVWDILDPTVPRRLGASAPLPGLVQGVVVRGGHAVVSATTDRGVLTVLDVSDPSAPRAVRSVDVGDSQAARPMELALQGDRLFVADAAQGLFAFDASRLPDLPAVAHVSETPVFALQLTGTRLYAQGSSHLTRGLHAYALDEQTTYLGSTLIVTARAAAVAGTDRLVVALGTRFEVRDVSQVASPVTLLSVPAVGAGRVIGTPDAAYVLASDGVHVLAFDDQGQPVHRGLRTGAIDPVTVTASGAETIAYATSAGELVIEDSGDPHAPAVLATARVAPYANAMAVGAARPGVVVSESSAGTLTALARADASSPGVTTRLTFDATGAASDVAIFAGHAYVAAGPLGVRVVGAETPLTQLARVTHASYVAALEVAHGRLYVGDTAELGGLHVWDLADPGAPAPLGRVTTGQVRDIALRDALAFVADEGFGGTGGMRIYDVSDPLAIEELATYDDCPSASSVSVAGSTVLLGCATGVHVVDVSDPLAPQLRFVMSPLGARAVAMDGTLGYVGHGRGVTVLDLRDPEAPRVLGELPTAAAVVALTVGPGHTLWVAAGRAGVYRATVDTALPTLK